MTEKPDVWVPIYIGDYLGDTGRLTTEQHGAYLLMIFDYWRSGPPADEDRALASITGLELRVWRRQRPVLQRFFRIEGGVWRHKRIDAELEAWAARKEKAVERAAHAARRRWEKAQADAPGNAPGIRQAMPEQCPSPSPLEEEASKRASSLQGRESARASPEARASRVLASPYDGTLLDPEPTDNLIPFPEQKAAP